MWEVERQWKRRDISTRVSLVPPPCSALSGGTVYVQVAYLSAQSLPGGRIREDMQVLSMQELWQTPPSNENRQ